MGSNEYPWFPLDAEDWMRSTATMTDEQAGAYLRLLCWAWLEHGLPNDEGKIRALGRWQPAAWKRIWTVVGPKWVERDGRLVNERQEAERTAAGLIKSERSAAGKKGAAKRWQGHSGAIGDGMAGSMANGQQIDAQVQVHPQLQVPERDLLPPPRAGAIELVAGQAKAAGIGLIGAWNNVAASQPGFEWLTVTAPSSHERILAALRARPTMDWWGDVFRRVVASDVLRGRVAWRGGDVKVVDFWFVLKHAEQIAAGSYDNPTKPEPAEPVLAAWQAYCPHVPKCVILTQCPDAWAVERARVLAESEETAGASA